MTNPFESENEDYQILVNKKSQHSLWPLNQNAPEGWSRVGLKGKRRECLEWIAANWKEIKTEMDR